MKTRDELHDYWKHPSPENTPQHYLKKKSSPFLLGLVKSVLPDTNAKILEVGCNVGRNLNCLWNAGYGNLSGVEINPAAVVMMKKKYKDMHASIFVGAIEDLLDDIGKHDLIYSMAVFCHIHTDSEFIFERLAESSQRFIITIEDEHHNTNRHIARNYEDLFTRFDFRQIEYHHEVDEMNPNYHARIFERINK